jgi:hypothetical protein
MGGKEESLLFLFAEKMVGFDVSVTAVSVVWRPKSAGCREHQGKRWQASSHSTQP